MKVNPRHSGEGSPELGRLSHVKPETQMFESDDSLIQMLVGQPFTPPQQSLDSYELIPAERVNLSAIVDEVSQDTDDFDAFLTEIAKEIEAPIQSLSANVNQWGNHAISLLFYKYQLSKDLSGDLWNACEIGDLGAEVATIGAKAFSSIDHIDPSFQGDLISHEILKVTLAYKIPAQLGKIGILIYKKIILDRLSELVKVRPEGMSEAQWDKFKEWIDTEKQELAATSKKVAIKIGCSVPKQILTILKVLETDLPILKLGLTQLCALLGPVIGSYELHCNIKKVKKMDKDISTFNGEMFRQTEEAVSTVIKKRYDTLMAMKDQTMPGTENSYHEEFDLILEKALDFPNWEDGRRFLEETHGLFLDSDVFSSKESLRELLEYHRQGSTSDGIKRQQCIETALAIFDTRDQVVDYLDHYGFSLYEDENNLESLKVYQKQTYNNMLVRFIDVKSTQQTTDSTRNALKTLTMKKQKIQRKGFLGKVMNSKIMLAALSISCVSTIVLSALTFSGVAIPFVVLLLPSAGVTGVSSALVAVGILKFHHNSPNLFMEYAKGSLLKIAAYSIPKRKYEIELAFQKMRKIKNAMAAQELTAQLNFDNLTPKEIETINKKNVRVQEDSRKIDQKIEKIESKINHWNEKIEPIAESVAKSKWMDFMQRDMGRKKSKHSASATDGNAKLLAEKRSPKRFRSNQRQEAESEVMEIIDAVSGGVSVETSSFDQEVIKIAKERCGVDITDPKEVELLNKYLLLFAP